MITLIEFIKKEFLQLKRDKRMLPLIFLAPILQLIIIGYAITFDVKNIPFVVCDLDRSEESRNFIESFKSSGYFTLTATVFNQKEIDFYLDKSLATIAIVIPKDFSSKINKGEKSDIQILVDGSDAYSANVSLSYITGLTFNFNKKILIKYFDQRGRPITFVKIDPEIRVWYNPELKSSNYFVPGIIGLLLTIMTLILTSMAIVKEKEYGTHEQLIVTPIRKFELIMGKLIPFTIIGFIEVLLVIAAAFIFFDIELKGSLLLLLISCIPFLFSTLGLGMLVSTISRTQQQAMMLAVFLIMLPFLYLSGFTFPVENMPPIIQFASNFIPLKYFLIIIRSIFLKGSGIAELWDEMLIMLAIGLVVFTLSVLVFRKQLS
ncbi:MAG: ABC transporter permease [Ignavibacteria bacterium]|jgi:ABC-2 type transport system permease protein|nr:ABC transporter permease [Ignavibacteria bacterium]MDH7528882.1 ABC transporter permease [Ignavibacteria bacterium]